MEKDKRKYLFDILPLMLTTVIAVAACFTAYVSFQAIKIANEQKRIQSRQEIFDYIKIFLKIAMEHSKRTKHDKKLKL